MSRRLLLAALAAALPATACQSQSIPSQGQAESVMTEAGPVSVVTLTEGLDHPWGMAFLPDGRLLVTERPGNLRIVGLDGKASDPLSGTPTVFAQGQGGLLDVALAPDFAQSGHVYLTFARPGPEGSAATAMGRGRLELAPAEGSRAMPGGSDTVAVSRLVNFETLFTEEPYITGPSHFGSRLAFSPEGHVFVTMGERFQFDPAQDPSNHLGSLVRLAADGSVPDDNPFVGQRGVRPEIWSYGHRNVESAAVDPQGQLWIVEMGPLGGDELNRIERGANYGWPAVSWGINYDGTEIPDPPTRPDFTDAVRHWSPVISPSGMTFYDGSAFPAWSGSAFIGSLTRQGLVRVALQNGAVAGEEQIPLGTRIRDVKTGPDGMLYVLTDEDDGKLWRLEPLTPKN